MEGKWGSNSFTYLEAREIIDLINIVKRNQPYD